MLSSKSALSLLFLVALLLSACQPVLPVDTEPTPSPAEVPHRILFVGSCITTDNGGLAEHLQAMAASEPQPLQVETASATVCSTPISGIWQTSFVQDRVQKGNWDVVVVQGSLSMGDDPVEYEEYVRKFDELIRDSGARTVLFMNWQRNYRGELAADYPQIDEIAQVTEQAGAAIDAEVAPVGIAWEKALSKVPGDALYQGDRTHATILGTYLTVSVIYAAIFDRSPVGISYRPLDLLPDPDSISRESRKAIQLMYDLYQMTDEEAEFAQRIAWETVQAYQAE